jgi:hypothetical protein
MKRADISYAISWRQSLTLAAHKAKYQEQSYGESEIFKQEYTKQVLGALNSTFTRRLPSAYQSGY